MSQKMVMIVRKTQAFILKSRNLLNFLSNFNLNQFMTVRNVIRTISAIQMIQSFRIGIFDSGICMCPSIVPEQSSLVQIKWNGSDKLLPDINFLLSCTRRVFRKTPKQCMLSLLSFSSISYSYKCRTVASPSC